MKTKQYNWVNLLNKQSVFNSEEIPIGRYYSKVLN